MQKIPLHKKFVMMFLPALMHPCMEQTADGNTSLTLDRVNAHYFGADTLPTIHEKIRRYHAHIANIRCSHCGDLVQCNVVMIFTTNCEAAKVREINEGDLQDIQKFKDEGVLGTWKVVHFGEVLASAALN